MRGQAECRDSLGNPFTLFDNATFDVCPHVLCVYDSDHETPSPARAYSRTTASCVIDLAVKGAVPALNLRRYGLGRHRPRHRPSGHLDATGRRRRITQNEIPVLSLGEGAYAYFGKLHPQIGYPQGAPG